MMSVARAVIVPERGRQRARHRAVLLFLPPRAIAIANAPTRPDVVECNAKRSRRLARARFRSDASAPSTRPRPRRDDAKEDARISLARNACVRARAALGLDRPSSTADEGHHVSR
jgi:hypothetical protein